MRVIVRNYLLVLVLLLVADGTALSACDNTKKWQGGLYLQPIANQMILNGKSIEMYLVVSKNCSVDCYKSYLDERSILALKQGNIVSVNNGQPSGVTLTIESQNPDGFTGKLVCLADGNFKPLSVPKGLNLPPATTDLQATDSQGTNRTMMYKNATPVMHARVARALQTQAKIIENNGGYKYFVLKDGLEVYLTYDSKRSHVMSIVYNKRKII